MPATNRGAETIGTNYWTEGHFGLFIYARGRGPKKITP